MKMRVILGLRKYCDKGLLSSSFQMHAGNPDISPVPQEGQYPPNTFLEINPFPLALPSLYLHLASVPMHKAILPGQMCWSCNPSAGCESCMFCWLCHAETLPFLWRNYMAIKLRGTVTLQVSVSSPLFPCLTFPLRNLSLDCGFWPGNKFDGSILKRQSLTGCSQHPNIVLRRVTNTSCLAYVLNELVDRHAFVFPIPVCNQRRKNFLDLLFFRNFWWGPSGNEWWNSNATVQRTSLLLLICGTKMGWQHQMHGSLTADWYAPSIVGLWLLLILPITQNSSELSSLWMKNVMFLEMYCF